MAFEKVAEVSQLAPGQCMVVEAGGRELALYNVEGEFFCTDNACPHREGPLGEGELEDDVVICPLHAWQFNVRTGEELYGAGMCVRTYPCKVEDGAVLVNV